MNALVSRLRQSVDAAAVRQRSGALPPPEPPLAAPKFTPADLAENFVALRDSLAVSPIAKVAKQLWNVTVDEIFSTLSAVDRMRKNTPGALPLSRDVEENNNSAEGTAEPSATNALTADTSAEDASKEDSSNASANPLAAAIPFALAQVIDDRRLIVCDACGHRRLQGRDKGCEGGACDMCGAAAAFQEITDTTPVAYDVKQIHWQLTRPRTTERMDRVFVTMQLLAAELTPPEALLRKAHAVARSYTVGSVKSRCAAALVLALDDNVVQRGCFIPRVNLELRPRFACVDCSKSWSRRIDARVCCRQQTRGLKRARVD